MKKRFFKRSSIFLLSMHIIIFFFYFFGTMIHQNKHVRIGSDFTKTEDGLAYISQINNIDFSHQKLYLEFAKVPQRLLSARSEDSLLTKNSHRLFRAEGKVESLLICNGELRERKTTALTGDYSVSRTTAFISLLKITKANHCDLVIYLYSTELSNLISSAIVVRNTKGELFGQDLRPFNVLLSIFTIGFYIALWYLSAFQGMPLFIGLTLLTINFCCYIFLRLKNDTKATTYTDI